MRILWYIIYISTYICFVLSLLASSYEGVPEPKTEPDADCHDDPKIGVLFNNIFSLYLHCVIFLSDCPKWKEENGGCSWAEWRDMCKKTCGLCGR